MVTAVCSNPLAGTDTTLLALSGTGYMGGKLFGFASCERAVGAAEGMNVLAERRVPVSKGAMLSAATFLKPDCGLSCPLFGVIDCVASRASLVRSKSATGSCAKMMSMTRSTTNQCVRHPHVQQRMRQVDGQARRTSMASPTSSTPSFSGWASATRLRLAAVASPSSPQTPTSSTSA